MRRPLVVRLLTAIWAVWLGVMLVEPAALHTCPAHGSHAPHAAHHMDASAAGHMAPGTHHDDPSGNRCTCLGACCCAPTVIASLGKLPELPVGRTVAVRVALVSAASQLVLSDPDYDHPFANGPPARV